MSSEWGIKVNMHTDSYTVFINTACKQLTTLLIMKITEYIT